MKKVEIHYSDKKRIPFGAIVSKCAIAIILSFYGPKDDVHDLMQRTSHLTRVYFMNEDRLKGFLVEGKEGIISSLKKDNQFYAIQVEKHYNISFDMLLQTLQGFLTE